MAVVNVPKWENLPSKATPVTAENLNAWGDAVRENAMAAELAASTAAAETQVAIDAAVADALVDIDAATAAAEAARDQAVAHTNLLAAPAIGQVAGYVNGVGGEDVRAALDATYLGSTFAQDAPPGMALHSWTGVPHDSTSVRRVEGSTRTNLCTNPRAAINLAGITAYGTGETLTRRTDLVSPPGFTTGVRVTTAASGTNQGVDWPILIKPSTTYTISMWVRRNSGTDTFAMAITAVGAGAALSLTAGQFVRVSQSFTTPSGLTPLTRDVGIRAASVSGVNELDVTGVLIEESAAVGTYFDGDTAAAITDARRANARNLWIDTFNGANTPHRFTGATWAPATDKAAAGMRIVTPGADGVVGNGTADDTAALQAIIDSAGSSLLREVVLRPGTYRTATLTMKANLTLRGQGAVILHAPGATAAAINIPSSATGARVEGVEVNGNASAQTNNVPGINVAGAGARVDGCTVTNVKFDGITVAGGTENVTITRNRVLTTGRYGITISGTSASPARRIVVAQNSIEGSAHGALGVVGVGEQVVFSANVTRASGGDGIAAYNAANRSIICVGNTIHSPGNHGMHLGGNRLVMVANTVEGVTGPGHGYFLRNHDATTINDVVVGENTVRTIPTGCGIRLEFTQGATVTGNVVNGTNADGIYLGDAFDATVSGNSVRTTTVGRGIHLVKSQRVTVAGNVLRDIGSFGIYGQDISTPAAPTTHINVTGNTIHTTQGRGIHSVHSSDRWVVANNIVQAWVTSAIDLAGANNVTSANLTT